MSQETRDLKAVEGIIDSRGMDGLLDVIADVCSSKAGHLNTNWQDAPAANRWIQAMVVVQGMKENRAIKGVIPRR